MKAGMRKPSIKKEHICKDKGTCNTSGKASTHSRIRGKRTWMDASEKEALQQGLQKDDVLLLGSV